MYTKRSGQLQTNSRGEIGTTIAVVGLLFMVMGTILGSAFTSQRNANFQNRPSAQGGPSATPTNTPTSTPTPIPDSGTYVTPTGTDVPMGFRSVFYDANETPDTGGVLKADFCIGVFSSGTRPASFSLEGTYASSSSPASYIYYTPRECHVNLIGFNPTEAYKTNNCPAMTLTVKAYVNGQFITEVYNVAAQPNCHGTSPTPTATNTPIPTATPTGPANTPTSTPTATNTPVPSNTPTATPTTQPLPDLTCSWPLIGTPQIGDDANISVTVKNEGTATVNDIKIKAHITKDCYPYTSCAQQTGKEVILSYPVTPGSSIVGNIETLTDIQPGRYYVSADVSTTQSEKRIDNNSCTANFCVGGNCTPAPTATNIRMYGFVKLANDNPVANIDVKLYKYDYSQSPAAEILQSTVKTESDGKYEFNGLSGGDYHIIPQSSVYSFNPTNSTVSPGATAEVPTFTATPIPTVPATTVNLDGTLTVQDDGFQLMDLPAGVTLTATANANGNVIKSATASKTSTGKYTYSILDVVYNASNTIKILASDNQNTITITGGTGCTGNTCPFGSLPSNNTITRNFTVSIITPQQATDIINAADFRKDGHVTIGDALDMIPHFGTYELNPVTHTRDPKYDPHYDIAGGPGGIGSPDGQINTLDWSVVLQGLSL